MEPTTAPRHSRRRLSFRHLLVAVGLGGAMLAGAPGAAAMSLIAVHAPDGAVYLAIAGQETDQDVVVSRSVGLMVGTTGPASEADLGASHVEVSRSVGLMVGTSGTAAEAQLGSAPILVSRSIGLMEGAQS